MFAKTTIIRLSLGACLMSGLLSAQANAAEIVRVGPIARGPIVRPIERVEPVGPIVRPIERVELVLPVGPILPDSPIVRPIERLDPVQRRDPGLVDFDPADRPVGSPLARTIEARGPWCADDADEGESGVERLGRFDRDLVPPDFV